ncbi:MAG: KpsF/GutQ family sugar-phosphate isomerase [Planctomycetales bacterium]|jgi:arabinose-5-phosphate isomerase|nr:KpsF/GutQ family sugar-phosphate isomerase [Planctomycetales bacterium]
MNAVRQSLADSAVVPVIVPFARLGPLKAGREIVAQEGQALLDLSKRMDGRFCDAIELLAACRGSAILTGIGKAGLIARKIAATLSSTGTRAHFIHPTEAMHGDLGCIGNDDIWIILSNSGETEELCRLLPLIRERRQSIIAITASHTSTIGAEADTVIELGRLIEAGVHGLAPSTSTTAMLAVGDSLALVLSQHRNFTPQQFAIFHPGGSLGRRLASVNDIMRSGEQIRIAADTATIREIFVGHARPGRRAGAVMLVDEEGRLSGLFTDSDLARLLERRQDEQFDRPISEVMTHHPLTIEIGSILEEAMQHLGARHVSELPVIDHDRRPVGLIDITDLIGIG